MPSTSRILVVVSLLLISLPSAADAQEAPRAIMEAGGGGLSTVQGMGSLTGGRIRGFFAERVSMGPEIQFWRDAYGRSILVMAGNLFLDIIPVSDDQRAVPYGFTTVGMASVFGSRHASSELLLGAGLGLRLHISDHIVIAPEVRATFPTGKSGQLLIGWVFH